MISPTSSTFGRIQINKIDLTDKSFTKIRPDRIVFAKLWSISFCLTFNIAHGFHRWGGLSLMIIPRYPNACARLVRAPKNKLAPSDWLSSWLRHHTTVLSRANSSAEFLGFQDGTGRQPAEQYWRLSTLAVPPRTSRLRPHFS